MITQRDGDGKTESGRERGRSEKARSRVRQEEKGSQGEESHRNGENIKGMGVGAAQEGPAQHWVSPSCDCLCAGPKTVAEKRSRGHPRQLPGPRTWKAIQRWKPWMGFDGERETCGSFS